MQPDQIKLEFTGHILEVLRKHGWDVETEGESVWLTKKYHGGASARVTLGKDATLNMLLEVVDNQHSQVRRDICNSVEVSFSYIQVLVDCGDNESDFQFDGCRYIAVKIPNDKTRDCLISIYSGRPLLSHAHLDGMPFKIGDTVGLKCYVDNSGEERIEVIHLNRLMEKYLAMKRIVDDWERLGVV